jgi:hypothetical protein
LSGAYIKELLSGSNRPIQYVVLPTLVDYDLGKLEIAPVATDIISRSPTNLNGFAKNVLQSCYLLASGYPRVTEKFYEWLMWEKNRMLLVSELKKNPESVENLILYLSNVVSASQQDKPDPGEIESVFKFIFDPRGVSISTTSEFREFLERGKVFMDRVIAPEKALAGVPFGSFVECQTTVTGQEGPYSAAVHELFQDIICVQLWKKEKKSPVATWFERCIDLTTICRVMCMKNDESMKFGPDSILNRISSLSYRVCNSASDWKRIGPKSELVIAPLNHAGVDSRVTVTREDGTTCFIYRQVKIQESSKGHSLTTIAAGAIARMVRQHKDIVPSMTVQDLSNVYMVFYVWYAEEKIEKKKVIAAAKVILKKWDPTEGN